MVDCMKKKMLLLICHERTQGLANLAIYHATLVFNAVGNHSLHIN